jgi:N-acetylglucosamine-6-phosphate deacetylase
MIALTATRLLTPFESIDQPFLLIENGVISDLGPRASRPLPAQARVHDFPGATLVPGLLDLHIHGGAGHDIMEADPAALPALERLLAQHGVSGYFPTTITAPLDPTLSALERLADAIDAAAITASAHDPTPRARPLGIHLEGPFLNHLRRGVHPLDDLLPPSLTAFERFWEAARGHIRIMTIAPELPGALEVIAEADQRGVCVSLGHSDAKLEEARAGIAAGACHATHTFNAMRPLNHRDPGILTAVLADPEISADVIADGIHVDPTVVRLLARLKGPEKTVLITDALAATGMPDGHYRLGTLEVEVRQGVCLSGQTLAGSVLTLDAAVRNLMSFAGVDLQQSIKAATSNPARAVGVSPRHGVLAPGARADIAVLDNKYQVTRTIIGGVV